MANDVTLSAALRNNLQSLQTTQKLIDTVQLRLATGLKVNSALDGPSQFFTSQSLTNRAGDLGRLLDGINLSIRTIQEADTGVTALTNLVQQARSVAEEAQSATAAASGFVSATSTKDLSGVADLVTNSGGTITGTTNIFAIGVYRDSTGTVTAPVNVTIASGDTIYDVAGTINSTAALNTLVKATVDSGGHLKITSLEEGNIIRITDGSATKLTAAGFAFLGLDNVVASENTVATTHPGGDVVSGHTIYSKVAAAAALVNGKYQASTTLANAGFTAGNFSSATDAFTISLNIDGTTTLISPVATTYNDSTTIQDVVDDINAAGLKVTASFDQSTGKIGLKYDDSVSSAQIVFTASTAGAGGLSFGFGTRATDVTTTANSVYSEAYTFVGTNVDTTQYKNDFNDIRSQIDDLVNDANLRGVNLLGGDTLTTYFNEDRTSSLDTVGVDFTSTGLGISAATFLTAGAIATSINEIDAALDSVRNFGQSISNSLSIIQTRADFTQSTISTLKAGAQDLVGADQNEEGANLLALQTRQQLGVTALSLAAQSQQSVLRLF